MIRLTIKGMPYSKSNRSKIITLPDGRGGTRSSLTKSKEAKDWERTALLQIPQACRVRLQGPVIFFAHIYYSSQRPDLDESLVLDILQDRWERVKHPDGTVQRQLVQAGVYCNDRQVREKHIWHGIDKVNPRVEIQIESMDPQRELALPPAPTLHIGQARPATPRKGAKVREAKAAPIAAPAPRAAMAKAIEPGNTVFKMLASMEELAARRQAEKEGKK